MRIAFPKRAKLFAAVLLPLALAGCGHVAGGSRVAVGTVVMNRMESGRYPRTVCGVVGQPNQFAPGVLSKRMTDSGRPRAFRMADAVLGGARHQSVGSKSMFFHTAGYRFPYNNMNYVAIAGGNSFYEKRRPGPGVMIARQEDVAARQQMAALGAERRSYEPPQRRVAFLASQPVRQAAPRRELASYDTSTETRRVRVASTRPTPIYQPEERVRVADARPAPYGYDAANDRFEPRPVRAPEPQPGDYGYMERADGDPYEPAPAVRSRDQYDDAPVVRSAERRPARATRQPVQVAEWGDGAGEPERRTIDPGEPMVLASAGPALRAPRPEAQSPRSIEDLIDEPAPAPRPRRAAQRVSSAPSFAGAPIFVPDR